MTAKEMFEELGYKLISDNVNFIIYEFEEVFRLTFDKNNGLINIWSERPMYNTLDCDELKAINKQIEELWWNND